MSVAIKSRKHAKGGEKASEYFENVALSFSGSHHKVVEVVSNEVRKKQGGESEGGNEEMVGFGIMFMCRAWSGSR